MNNKEIRIKAKEKGVKLWEVAEALKIQASGLSCKLRHELPEDEKIKILAIIDSISASRKAV